MLIHKLLGKGLPIYIGEPSDRLVDSNTFIGIEIELEEYSTYRKPLQFKYWLVTHDGSLRPRDTGVEFITNGPMGGIIGQEIPDALDIFAKTIKYNDEEFDLLPTVSDRCSVHVHINAGDLTLKQFQKWIGVYLIFEKCLFEYVGEDRYYNNYCIPLLTNGKLLPYIISKNVSNNALSNMLRHTLKYDAFNMKSLNEKGTVEFRHHPGCYDSERILEWVNILLCIKRYAQHSANSWLNILSSVSGKGPLEFAKEVFGPYYEKIYYGHLDLDIMESIREVQQIEYRKEIAEAEVYLNTLAGSSDLSAFFPEKVAI